MAENQAHHRAWSLFIRVYIAALLLFAAFSQARLVSTQKSHLIPLLKIAFEVLLAAWLASGIRVVWSTNFTIAVFTVFVFINAYKSLYGAPTCGCFGPLAVRPSLTLSIDLAVLAALAGGRPGPLWALRAALISLLILVLSVLLGMRIYASA